jgi:hypothetical protein
LRKCDPDGILPYLLEDEFREIEEKNIKQLEQVADDHS